MDNYYSSDTYKDKYIKYKNKYLSLKKNNTQIGASAKEQEECIYKVGDVIKSNSDRVKGLGLVASIENNNIWADMVGFKGDQWSFKCDDSSIEKIWHKNAQDVANEFLDGWWENRKDLVEQLNLVKPTPVPVIDTGEKANSVVDQIKELLKTDEFQYITQSIRQVGIKYILENKEMSPYSKISTVFMILIGSIKTTEDILESQIKIIGPADSAGIIRMLENAKSFKLRIESLQPRI